MTVCTHILRNILVADLGLFVSDAELVKCLVQTHIGHDGGHYPLIAQNSAVLHIFAANIQNVVTGYNVALFINRKAPVGVAVKCKAHIEAIFDYKPL